MNRTLLFVFVALTLASGCKKEPEVIKGQPKPEEPIVVESALPYIYAEILETKAGLAADNKAIAWAVGDVLTVTGIKEVKIGPVRLFRGSRGGVAGGESLGIGEKAVPLGAGLLHPVAAPGPGRDEPVSTGPLGHQVVPGQHQIAAHRTDIEYSILHISSLGRIFGQIGGEQTLGGDSQSSGQRSQQ